MILFSVLRVPWLKRSLSFFLSFLFCVSCPGLTYSIYLSPPLVVVVVVVCSLSSEALSNGWMDDDDDVFFCSFGGVVLVFCVCFLSFLICVVGKSER